MVSRWRYDSTFCSMGFLTDYDLEGVRRHLGVWVELIPTCVGEVSKSTTRVDG